MGGSQRSYFVDPEDQKKAKEAAKLMLLKMSVIQIQIRSHVPGVMMNGSYTIPIQVAVNRKWTDVFRMDKVQVRMDPEIHQLIGRGKEIDINSEVFDYYRQFHRNRSIYMVDILERPPPKSDPKSPKGRRAKGTPKCRGKAKSVNKSPMTEKDRTRSQRRDTATVNNQSVKTKVPKMLTPARPKKHSRDQHLPSVARSQKQEPRPAASTPFGMPASFQSQTPPLAHPERFIFRDESTMAGDVRYDGEEDVKTGILKFLNDHYSNRDMLEIRQELTALKRQQKFQSLNRLIRFTSGFLQNAFVDDHS